MSAGDQTINTDRLVDIGQEDEVDYEDVQDIDRWTIGLTTDGDLDFNDATNTFNTVHFEEAVKQSLSVAVGTIEGEDPLDEDFGLDVFRATRSIAFLEREVRRTLTYDDAEHTRVNTINDVQISRDVGTRRAHVDVYLTLDSGGRHDIRLNLEMVR